LWQNNILYTVSGRGASKSIDNMSSLRLALKLSMEGAGSSEESKKDSSKPSNLKPTPRKRSNSEMAMEEAKSGKKPSAKEDDPEGINAIIFNC
jgi:hypothetical protein